MAVLGKVGATGLLALMGLVGSVRADSAKHAATTLDWTLAPFKGLLSKLVVYTVGKENTSCLKTDEYVKQVSTDFINFSRLYMSPDFPRGYAKTYSAMPLLIYVAVLFYVLWIIVTIGWCVFRCCCRKAKCCNPVLYAKSGKQRRKKECCCACCYGFSMILFLGTTALTIVAVLLSDKLLKSADEKLVDPLNKYMHNLPTRLRAFVSGDGAYENNVKTILEPFTGDITIDPFGEYLGKYAAYRFDDLLGTILDGVRYWDAITDLGNLIDSQNEDEYVLKKLQAAANSISDSEVKALFTDAETYFNSKQGSIPAMKFVGTLVQNISGSGGFIDKIDDLIDGIGNENLKKLFKENEEPGSDPKYVLSQKLEECLIHYLGDDKKEIVSSTCFPKAIEAGIEKITLTDDVMEMLSLEDSSGGGEKTKTQQINELANSIETYLGEYSTYIDMLRDFLKGDPTKLLEFIYKQIGVENTSSGNEDEDPEVSGGSMEVYSNDSLPNLPYDKIFKVLSWMIKNYIPLFCGVFAGIMFFFYIFPLMLALCLRKRNRKQGKCACKAWIKCTTCCCAIWTPYSLILCGVSMVLAPIVYFISMAYIMSSDSSTFDAAGETPAPIGSAFSTCILGGQMDKRVLLENMFAGEDGKVPETTGALINLGTEFLSKTIAPLLFCEKPGATDAEKDGITLQGVIPLDDETTDSYDDEELMKKYGTFFTAVFNKGNMEILQKAVKEGFNDENIRKLLCSLGEDMCPESEETTSDVLLKYIDGQFGEAYEAIKGSVNDSEEEIDKLRNAETDLNGWNLLGLHMFITEAAVDNSTGELSKDWAKISNWNEVQIPSAFRGNMAKISGLRVTVSDDYAGDLKTLTDECRSGTSCDGTIKLTKPFMGLMTAIENALSSNNTADSEDVKSMIGKLEEGSHYLDAVLAAEKVKCASKKILNGAADSVKALQGNDLKLNEEKAKETIGETSYDALRGTVSGILDKIEDKTKDGFKDKPAIYDLMTCYPLGALSTYGLDSVNKTSNTQTMSAVGLMVFVLACLLMMIVANCGPLVYNERYKRKCCCCCYQEAKAPPPTKAYTVRSGNTGNVVQPAAIDVVVDNNDGRVVVRQPGNGYYPSSNIQTYHSTNSMPPSYAPMPEGGQYRMVYVADSRDLQGSKRPRRTVK